MHVRLRLKCTPVYRTWQTPLSSRRAGLLIGRRPWCLVCESGFSFFVLWKFRMYVEEVVCVCYFRAPFMIQSMELFRQRGKWLKDRLPLVSEFVRGMVEVLIGR